MVNESPSSTFRHKLKSSMRCFRPDHHQFLEKEEDDAPRSASCACVKSIANEFPEQRDRCRNMMSRISRMGRSRWYHHSADFSYDASSYALNFEDKSREDEWFPMRDFSSRLPASPQVIREECESEDEKFVRRRDFKAKRLPPTVKDESVSEYEKFGRLGEFTTKSSPASPPTNEDGVRVRSGIVAYS